MTGQEQFNPLPFLSRRSVAESVPYSESLLRTIEIQELLWTQFKKGAELKIEILSPLKAKVTKYKHSSYVKFLCIACESSSSPELEKGDCLYIQFPLKTWERGMYSVPMSKKREWNTLGDDNIYVHLIKAGKSLVEFVNVERRASLDRHKELVQKYLVSEEDDIYG